jgi:outer membrane protein assembly factor BamB
MKRHSTSAVLWRRALSRGAALGVAVLLLCSCDQAKRMFGDAPQPPLKGERISVLQLQKDLAPNPQLKDTPIKLPDAWTNQFWPQGGGYPNHALGHLALGDHLRRAWKASIGAGADDRAPLTASPVVAEGCVFTLDTQGRVSAFDLATGKRKWEKSVVPRDESGAGALGGGLAYASGRLFVVDGYKVIDALNAQTGVLSWKAEITSPARAAPTVIEDKLFIVTLDNRLLALSAADGTLQWGYTGTSQMTNLLGSAAPAADPSLVVLPLSSGQVFGLRPENGQVVWEDNLSAVRRVGALSSISDIRGLPVIDQGVVYAISFSGRMVALDEVTGRRIWQREIGGTETPWAAGDTVFLVTAEQQLVALTRSQGDIHWVTQLPRYVENDRENPIVWSGPVLAGGRLFIVSSSGEMDEIDAQTGTILRKQKTGAAATIPPVVAAGTLLVLTDDGELSAWR